jgi:hypothetical protein
MALFNGLQLSSSLRLYSRGLKASCFDSGPLTRIVHLMYAHPKASDEEEENKQFGINHFQYSYTHGRKTAGQAGS